MKAGNIIQHNKQQTLSSQAFFSLKLTTSETFILNLTKLVQYMVLFFLFNIIFTSQSI